MDCSGDPAGACPQMPHLPGRLCGTRDGRWAFPADRPVSANNDPDPVRFGISDSAWPYDTPFGSSERRQATGVIIFRFLVT